MIVIFTDYGLQGPYLGQIDSILAEHAPGERVITLLADAPPYNPKASAYLLAALSCNFSADSVFFAVVDPAVGNDTEQPIIINADGCWYVGPDNGIFDLLARKSSKLKAWQIDWRPEELSSTFHGRDLYAPVCAMLANKQPVAGNEFAWSDRHKWPDNLYEIIYIDHFGNLMTGIQAGHIEKSGQLALNGKNIPPASFFSAVKTGQQFWYENSSGLVEIAVNQGNAEQYLEASIGDMVELQA